MISVAAELAGMHPQTLRIYETRGLITPKRSPKNTRLYSDEDVERLRRIQELTTELGMNLAGVEKVFELEREIARMRAADAQPRAPGGANRAGADRGGGAGAPLLQGGASALRAAGAGAGGSQRRDEARRSASAHHAGAAEAGAKLAQSRLGRILPERCCSRAPVALHHCLVAIGVRSAPRAYQAAPIADYDCPDQPPAHPGEDYLRNCPAQ